MARYILSRQIKEQSNYAYLKSNVQLEKTV